MAALASVTSNRATYYEENHTNAFSFDGAVTQEGDQLRIVLRTSGEFGVIKGLLVLGQDGKTFRLVETARMIDGKMLEGVGDPDAYRVLVDLAQEAFEGNDWVRYRILRDRVRYSPFKCCPACCDSFAQREDCETCGGQGFVPDNQGEPGCAEDLASL